jgi:hypothetical protein
LTGNEPIRDGYLGGGEAMRWMTFGDRQLYVETGQLARESSVRF